MDSGSTFAIPLLTPPYQRESPVDLDYTGGEFQARWRRIFASQSQLTVQTYFQYGDVATTDNIGGSTLLNGATKVADVEIEYGTPLGDRQQLVVGAEYRSLDVSSENSEFFMVDNTDASNDIFSVFVQDEIWLTPSDLTLTLASRFDYNSLTGFEVQPSGRVLWQAMPGLSLWGAVSRAVRTPSLVEVTASRFFFGASPGVNGLPVALFAADSNQPLSEEVVTYEGGIRATPWSTVSLDATVFYNVYDSLFSVEATTPRFVSGPPPRLESVFRFDNKLSGEGYGFELSADWLVTDSWRLSGSYSFLDLNLRASPSSTDTVSVQQERTSPSHQAVIRSSFDITSSIDFDLVLRAVDELEAISVPGYAELDARLAWRPVPGIELAVVGRNLVDGGRKEFVETLSNVLSTEVERSVYGAVTVRY